MTKKMGRPKKEIKQEQFEAMCQIQATHEEIQLVLGVSDKTLNAWCKRTYGRTFSDVFREKRELGKISLRRKQWKLADRSATMAIFLGKQYLGQRDISSVENTVDMRAEVKTTNAYDELTVEELRVLAEMGRKHGDETEGN